MPFYIVFVAVIVSICLFFFHPPNPPEEQHTNEKYVQCNFQIDLCRILSPINDASASFATSLFVVCVSYTVCNNNSSCMITKSDDINSIHGPLTLAFSLYFVLTRVHIQTNCLSMLLLFASAAAAVLFLSFYLFYRCCGYYYLL